MSIGLGTLVGQSFSGHAMNTHFRNRDHILSLGLCLVIVLCGSWSYRNSFLAPFIFDDETSITKNPLVGSFFASYADGHPVLRHRPVGRWSLALNVALGGFDVRGYHAFNLAVHLAAGLLLFDVMRRSLALAPSRSVCRQSATVLALAVALIWVVHPLQTQSVTYIIQRLEALCGLFYLACLYCVLRGSQSRLPLAWYLAAVAACWLGMGTKEVMVTAPAVVLLYDRVYLADSWATVMRRRWAVYAGFLPALAWLVVTAIPRLCVPNPKTGIGFGYEGITAIEYLRSQPGVILHYFRLAFWPDRLCFDYMWPVARTPVEILLPGAVIMGLLLASLLALRWWPRVGFLGVALFLILAPTSSIVPFVDLAFEYRMYLPLAPLVALAVLGFGALANLVLQTPRARTRVWVSALVVTTLALMLRTSIRNRLYLDPEAMWFDVVATAPHNCRAHSNLGACLQHVGRIDEALACYRRALQIKPDYTPASYNLAVQLARRGDVERAIAQYQKTLEISPRHVNASFDLAELVHQHGEVEQAITQYRRTLELKPDHAKARKHLATLLAAQGKAAVWTVHRMVSDQALSQKALDPLPVVRKP